MTIDRPPTAYEERVYTVGCLVKAFAAALGSRMQSYRMQSDHPADY
jgi:hypothetical protein